MSRYCFQVFEVVNRVDANTFLTTAARRLRIGLPRSHELSPPKRGKFRLLAYTLPQIVPTDQTRLP